MRSLKKHFTLAATACAATAGYIGFAMGAPMAMTAVAAQFSHEGREAYDKAGAGDRAALSQAFENENRKSRGLALVGAGVAGLAIASFLRKKIVVPAPVKRRVRVEI